MFGVLLFTLSLTLVCASDRRLVDQINNLRKELSYSNSDISSLFQHFDMLNKTIWSNLLGSSMKGREEHALEQIGDLSDRKSLMAMFNHKLVTLQKGFDSEKKLNRLLIKRLEAAEKQNAEKDAEMKTRHSEFSDMMERTNRLNLLLSKQAKALKKSTSDLRNELEAERQLNAQLQIDYGTMISECSELTAQIQKDYLALKDDVSKFKTGFLIDYQAMKDEFLDLKNQCQIDYGSMQDEVSVLKAKIQMDYGLMKDDIFELAKNVSTITKSCDILSTNTPNDVTLQTSTLIMQERDTTTPVPVPTSCKDQQTSGVYNIFTENSVKTSIYCDADTDDGGWIVILRRQDGSVNFNTTWTEYKNGFGNLDGEFWIGNDFLHQLTKTEPMELRVDMEDEDGNKVFAKYAVFKVGSEADKYGLSVSGYSGTAWDGLGNVIVRRNKHSNGMKFSTFDQDNDQSGGNCAGDFGGGGWWYNDCINSLLTGTWRGKMDMYWHDGVRYRPLKFAEMKIR